MRPLYSPILKKLAQPIQVPGESPPNLGAPVSSLPRGARERGRQLHPRQALPGVICARRAAVLDRAVDPLLLRVPREVREVPGVGLGVAGARVVVIHHFLEARDAAHTVDDLEAASYALGAQAGVFCVVLLAVEVPPRTV